MEDAVEAEQGISPGVVFLVAILSVGGLIFVGWQASLSNNQITGNLLAGPYTACCTVEPWGHSQAGYRQATGVASTEVCQSNELPNQCCMRAGKDRFKSPVKLLDSRAGGCAAIPAEVSYPYPTGIFAPISRYTACCQTRAWTNSNLGFSLGPVQLRTEYCPATLPVQTCCARAEGQRVGNPVQVMSASVGSCPELSYPAGEYSACCQVRIRASAPTGTIQAETKANTETCSSFESMSDCCSRAGSQRYLAPVQLVGSKQGPCNEPKTAYPSAATGGYPMCCTLETWQQSPSGYAQSAAQTVTLYCNPSEKPALCCFRAGADHFEKPVKILGFKAGGCETPELSYPTWVYR